MGKIPNWKKTVEKPRLFIYRNKNGHWLVGESVNTEGLSIGLRRHWEIEVRDKDNRLLFEDSSASKEEARQRALSYMNRFPEGEPNYSPKKLPTIKLGNKIILWIKG